MKKENTVRVQSDTSTLLHALQATFTDHTKVLGELLQNGRRAKATRIDITVTDKAIVFADDGVGIEDPSVLLSVAKSGWDEGTMKDESPYGIGWLSCLFACETVSVQSKGKHLIAMTEDLLALKPVVVNESAEIGVTEIRLLNHRLGSVDAIRHRIADLVAGFPIPVTLNDEQLPRPSAIDGSGDWIEGEVCLVRRNDALSFGHGAKYFLQGLPISVGHRFTYGGSHPIHLKSPQVKGRLPERDSVLEPDRVQKMLDRDAKRLAAEEAHRLAAEGRFDVLLTHVDALLTLDLLHLLDGGGKFPQGLLAAVTETPRNIAHEGIYSDSYMTDLADQSLEGLHNSGKTIYVLDGCDTAEDLLGLHYVKAVDGLVLAATGLSVDRYIPWLERYAKVVRIEGADFTVTGVEQVGEGNVDLWDLKGVSLVKAVELSHPTFPSVRVTEAGVLCPTERVLFVAEGANAFEAACQCSDFLDEDERIDEAYRDRIVDELHLLMLEVFGAAEPEKLFAQVLSNCLKSLPSAVKGKTFTVTIDAMGNHQVSC